MKCIRSPKPSFVMVAEQITTVAIFSQRNIYMEFPRSAYGSSVPEAVLLRKTCVVTEGKATATDGRNYATHYCEGIYYSEYIVLKIIEPLYIPSRNVGQGCACGPHSDRQGGRLVGAIKQSLGH